MMEANLERRRFAANMLDARLKELVRQWDGLRASPSRDGVDLFREQLAALLVDADQIARLLREGPPARPEESGRPLMRPSARDLIHNNRALDSALWDAAGAWRELQRQPGLEGISAVESNLREALARAEALRGVLEIAAASPGRAPHKPYGVSSPGGAADPADGGAGLALDALLWRIQSDWQHVRKSPTVERVGVLRGELKEALDTAAQLREGISGAREVAPESLDSGVARFPLFRDPATGAYTRAGFDSIASAELRRCRRYHRAFGLIVIQSFAPDLEALRERVELLRDQLREYDLLSRYLDPLLVVGLPESDERQTRRVAARIEAALYDGACWGPDDRIATAGMPSAGETLAVLMATARRRLSSAVPKAPPASGSSEI